MDGEFKKRLKNQIEEIKSPDGLYSLFDTLNYGEFLHDTSYKRGAQRFDLKKEDRKKIKEIFPVLTVQGKIQIPVFLLETNTLKNSFIKSVTRSFGKEYLHYMLIFTVDYEKIIFVFPIYEKTKTGTKLKQTKLEIQKDQIHYTDLETLSKIAYEGEEDYRHLWNTKWKEAFRVDRVTEDFFKGYKKVFFDLRENLKQQDVSLKDVHEFTLQFLNRIMFVYFISRKGWLSKTRFMKWLWEQYKGINKLGSDEFYEIWIKQIFFKAFNNQAHEVKKLPDNVVKAIAGSPYLNGGLFTENKYDLLEVKISDEMFKQIFKFFEKYNFTIKEDMPLDEQVAVDPEMIGNVYESLANVAGDSYEEDLQNSWGIFYTPRIEVDFMCRRSVVEYLAKNMPNVNKAKIYQLLFGTEEERKKAEKWFDQKDLWSSLESTLDNLSVADPACGSGAFLIGLLNVLDDLYKTIYQKLNRKDIRPFERKLGIVQRSLYGVDIMPWAVHAAELRLWLQLIVETDFKDEELREHPLLPNLDLNLRVGDSLVQEIEGINFNLRNNEDIKPELRKKLNGLKNEKQKYFDNSPTAKFKTPKEVKEEEIKLFEEIIDDRINTINDRIEELNKKIKKEKSQKNLNGKVTYNTEKVKALEQEINNYKKKIENLQNVKQVLKNPEKKPFVWDIDFAEIFGDKNGFDIVISNPPYVRSKEIAPPTMKKEDITLNYRRNYKNKLIKSVKSQFPVIEKLNKKSDYYIYFYFQGLSLLNGRGTFCFITSNSWLDVGYGKVLQEFLCKYVPIHAIYDNPKRSFEQADINTVITLFGPPDIKQRGLGGWLEGINGGNGTIWPAIEHTAKFVMFKKPFKEVLSSAKNLIDIDKIKIKTKDGESLTELVDNVNKTNDYRVFPMKQEDLLEDGWEYPEDYEGKRFKKGKYKGNKWGGKLLRAPNIFYVILNKGKEFMKQLSELFEGECYLNTGGADSFFILNNVERYSENIFKIRNDKIAKKMKNLMKAY